MTEKERFSAYILQEYNSDVVWHEGNPIKAMDLMLWLAWRAATQREGFKFVPVEANADIVEAAIDCMISGGGYDDMYEAMIGAADDH